MNDPIPITHWIDRARLGDDDAILELWKHYFAQLSKLARSRMSRMCLGIYDEEDAALSAMHSFFRGVRMGGYPELNDRISLWRLLVVITNRKISRRRQIDSSQKRGGQSAGIWSNLEFVEIIDQMPTPEFASEMLDELQQRLNALPDEQLRRIVMLTLEGLTQPEIAQIMKCTDRTIRRKLDAIRAVWEDQEANAK